MACKLQACIDCNNKCLLFHGQREKMASSFFKVMFGDRFSKIMFFPPKVAQIVSPLIGKESVLEDSTGMQWKVRVAPKENSYALEEGWSAFASEHGLELGDFLVFHYIREAHFLVQVFDKSSCQKLDFSANSRRTKAESERDSHGKERSSNVDTEMEDRRETTNIQGREKLSKVDNTDDSCLNIVPLNRFKSSNLETVRNSGQNSPSPSKESLNSEKLGKHLQNVKLGQAQTSHMPIGAHDKALRVHTAKTDKKALQPVASSFTCQIQSLKPFLELPAPLPVRFQKGESSSHGFTVVYLQDPQIRVWPVVYHLNQACGLRVLGSGWETIRKANNIRPGDECVFETLGGALMNQVLVKITRKAS